MVPLLDLANHVSPQPGLITPPAPATDVPTLMSPVHHMIRGACRAVPLTGHLGCSPRGLPYRSSGKNGDGVQQQLHTPTPSHTFNSLRLTLLYPVTPGAALSTCASMPGDGTFLPPVDHHRRYALVLFTLRRTSLQLPSTLYTTTVLLPAPVVCTHTLLPLC